MNDVELIRLANENASLQWVRYEVILPSCYNDGMKVPAELLKFTVDEVLEQFGAITLGSGSFRGIWKDDEKVYDEENCSFFVDTKDTEETLAWFQQHKEEWKLRFKQHSLWITSRPIRII